MAMRYFDFFGTPARMSVDDEDIPERCEIYDPEQGAFVRRDELIPDVMDKPGSRLVSEEDFRFLLGKFKDQANKQTK